MGLLTFTTEYLSAVNMSGVNGGLDLPFADPEKALLIQKIANLLGPEIIAPMNRTIWGALWLADTEMLQSLSELPPINLRSSLRFAETSKVIAKCELPILNRQSKD